MLETRSLIEAAATGSKTQSQAMNAFLDLMTNVKSSDVVAHIKPAVKAAVIGHIQRSIDDLPITIANKALKGAEVATGAIAGLPDRMAKRTIDAVLGKQKLRMKVNQAMRQAALVSDSYADTIGKQIVQIKKQLDSKELTPGQAKKSLLDLIRDVDLTVKRRHSGIGGSKVTVHVRGSDHGPRLLHAA